MTGLLDFDRVTARGVVKTYGATRALAGVDLELRAGRVTVIEGANGSGKSTLATLLTLVGRPTRGTVRWGEHDGTSQREGLRARGAIIALITHDAPLAAELADVRVMLERGRVVSVDRHASSEQDASS